MNRQANSVFAFGPFRLDTKERQLLREGRVVPLTPKLLDILEVLVRSRGRLIGKAELMGHVWPDTAVEQNNLTVNMCALRKVLGDDPSRPRYIETVPRRGYRFVPREEEEIRDRGDAGRARPGYAAASSAEPFVGRETELRLLDELLERAIQGEGRIAFIVGEPGIGKTTLAEQFIDRARRRFPALPASTGRCLEHYGIGAAYLPFFDCIGNLLPENGGGTLAEAFRRHAPTWCLEFPGRFGPPESLESLRRETLGANKERMLREMVEALRALGAETSMILLLEDLHWADPSSIDLLRHLSTQAAGLPLLVLGTFRTAELESRGNGLKAFKLEMQTHNRWVEIAPGMFSEQDLRRYLHAGFQPNDFPAELPNLIHLKTEGQPLFATSLIRFLAENGDICRTNGTWRLTRPTRELALDAPENVRSMIRRKIEALGEEDRRVLQYASVEGQEFCTTVLADLLGGDPLELEERLNRLSKVHLIVEELGDEELPEASPAARYRFCHALYRDFLYRELGRSRRILLHLQAGESLLRHHHDEARNIAAQLAIHFERGRNFPRALTWLLHAGDNAARLHAGLEAEECYSRALKFVDRLPPQEQSRVCAEIYRKRGTARFAQGRLDAAGGDFGRMLDFARGIGDFSLQHAALIALGRVSFFQRKLEDVAEHAGEAKRWPSG
jgi:DNA-binding winged helix-turn-helix (wHTH) protein